MVNQVYKDDVEWLFNQFPVFQKIGEDAYKPTLKNTQHLVQELNVPIHKMKFVHVAGTNGKGTTCSIIASALTTSGRKVGLFTSPHIKDFSERIRINGEKISKEKVIEYIQFFKKAHLNFSPSFFEMTWAMALAYFYERNCDIVVVEAGLGGRLDATNIISPVLSVITNIGLEHINILGNTRAEIAKEKAGIIKVNTPVIIGETDDEVNPIFIKIASEKNAPIAFLEHKKGTSTFETNKRLASLALNFLLLENEPKEKILKEAIENIHKNTGFYGRQYIFSKDPLIIMDVAHNPMAIQRLIQDIKSNYLNKKIRVLYGASNDKDIEATVSLFPLEWNYYFTTFSNKRSTTIDEFKKLKATDSLNVNYFEDASKAFDAAQHAMREDTVLLVFGSFFLVEEII